MKTIKKNEGFKLGRYHIIGGGNFQSTTTFQSAATSFVICPCCEANIPKDKIKQVKIPYTNKIIEIKEKT